MDFLMLSFSSQNPPISLPFHQVHKLAKPNKDVHTLLTVSLLSGPHGSKLQESRFPVPCNDGMKKNVNPPPTPKKPKTVYSFKVILKYSGRIIKEKYNFAI